MSHQKAIPAGAKCNRRIRKPFAAEPGSFGAAIRVPQSQPFIVAAGSGKELAIGRELEVPKRSSHNAVYYCNQVATKPFSEHSVK
jgi:hypothetical protein